MSNITQAQTTRRPDKRLVAVLLALGHWYGPKSVASMATKLSADDNPAPTGGLR